MVRGPWLNGSTLLALFSVATKTKPGRLKVVALGFFALI
jgi:hypothetical protein